MSRRASASAGAAARKVRPRRQFEATGKHAGRCQLSGAANLGSAPRAPPTAAPPSPAASVRALGLLAAAALESVLREQPFDSLEPAVMEAYADTCEMLSDKDGLHADAGHLQRTIAAEQALLKHSSVSPQPGERAADCSGRLGGRSRGR